MMKFICICLCFMVSSVLLADEKLFETSATPYDKYVYYARKNDHKNASPWLYTSALMGHEDAILILASNCIHRDKKCANHEAIKTLLQSVVVSKDLDKKAFAHILLGKLLLINEPSFTSMQLALDHFLIAYSYYDEGAVPNILTVLKQLTVLDKGYSAFTLKWIDSELETAKVGTLYYLELVDTKKFIEALPE